MKKKLSNFLSISLSIILICSFVILSGCARNIPDTASASSQASVQEPAETQSGNESVSGGSEIESTEESVTVTEELLSEKEIITEAEKMLEQESKPSILLEFLDENIRNLGMENANRAFDDLEKLLKIYEVRYTDELLSGKNGSYQQAAE